MSVAYLDDWRALSLFSLNAFLVEVQGPSSDDNAPKNSGCTPDTIEACVIEKNTEKMLRDEQIHGPPRCRRGKRRTCSKYDNGYAYGNAIYTLR